MDPVVATGILDHADSLVTKAFEWVGDAITAITSDTSGMLVTFVVAVPLVGLGVGLFKRLIHTRG